MNAMLCHNCHVTDQVTLTVGPTEDDVMCYSVGPREAVVGSRRWSLYRKLGR